MKNLALVLATLCVFAQATSVLQTPVFLQLKKDPFGGAIASLIEMNMQVPSGSLDGIANVINTIEETLNSRQSHNGDEISRERGWCDDQKAVLNNQLDKANNDKASYEAEEDSLETEQVDTQNKLENENKDLAANQQNKDNTVQALADENTRYEAAAKDYAEAIQASEQAISLLNTLQVNPAGFLQSKARFGNVVALLQKHLANKSSPLIQPVLTVLAELASSSSEIDQSKLQKIINLIQQLLAELRSQQSDNEYKHTNSVDSLNESISNLETLIQNSKAAIERFNSRLDQIKDRLSQLADLLVSIASVISTTSGQLQNTTDTCNGYEADYVKVTSQLETQIATLEKVKQYFLNQVVPSVQNVRDSSYEDQLTVDV